MVRYSIADIKEGMILGKSLYSHKGELLLAAGHRIKHSYVKRLQHLGYQFIYIHEPGTEQVYPEEILSEHTLHELEVSLAKSYDGLENLKIFKDLSLRNFEKELLNHRVHLKNLIISPELQETIKVIIENIMQNTNLVYNLSSLKGQSEYLYQHAMHVAIISLCIGQLYHYSREDMEQLAIGSLCYDIGMLAIPKEILNKQSSLTEEEYQVLKEHTTYGFLLLSQNSSIPSTAAAIALQHHERQDGLGYPRGLRGNNQAPIKAANADGKIHRFAQIVAVADTFDAILSKRPYAPPAFPPESAIKRLKESSGLQLNEDIVNNFVEIVPLYPVGMKFKIEFSVYEEIIGFQGVISKQNEQNLAKPELLLLNTSRGERLHPPKIISMSEDPSLKIQLLL